jgi:hypothetical protein
MPSTDPKPELTAKASMAQPVSQPAVYASGLIRLHVGNGEHELCHAMPDHTTGIHCGISKVKVKVKQSRNRPGVAQSVPGGLGPKIS